MGRKVLPAVQWGQDVRTIKPHACGFEVFTETGAYLARNLIVGTGPRPSVPVMAMPLLGEQVFHSSDYLFKRQALAGRRVAVIGGGQSGAEIVLDLLGQSIPPSEIVWVSSRTHLAPLDESHFANELYTPAYVEYFWGLERSKKHQLLAQHTLTSDGISPETLEALYQRLYHLRFVEDGAPCRLMHSRRVEDIRPTADGYLLDIRELDTAAQTSSTSSGLFWPPDTSRTQYPPCWKTCWTTSSSPMMSPLFVWTSRSVIAGPEKYSCSTRQDTATASASQICR